MAISKYYFPSKVTVKMLSLERYHQKHAGCLFCMLFFKRGGGMLKVKGIMFLLPRHI